MRLFTVSFTIWALCSNLVATDIFRLPSEAFSVDQLAEAKAAAREKNKPVGFLMSEQNSGSSATAESTLATIREFKGKVVLVYIEAESGDWKKLPENVRQAFTSPSAG